MNESLKPGSTPRAFLDLVDAVARTAPAFGPVLQSAGLDLGGFERLCIAWVQHAKRHPDVGVALADRVLHALDVVSRGAPPVDDLMGATLAVSPLDASPPSLPFRQGAGSTPAIAPRDPSGAAPTYDEGGATIAASVQPLTARELPFVSPEECARSKRLPAEKVAELEGLFAADREKGRAELERVEIDEAELALQIRSYLEEAAAAAGRGDFAPTETYDKAYVDAIERARGPITAAEYGRIVVAVERRRLPGVLDALRMGGASYVRIERHWLTRMSRDPELFRSSMEAVREARRG